VSERQFEPGNPDAERARRRRAPGVPEIGPLGARRTGAGGTGRGGISEARAFTPRGRTVRDGGGDRPAGTDRPRLRLLDGGQPDDAAGDPRTRLDRYGPLPGQLDEYARVSREIDRRRPALRSPSGVRRPYQDEDRRFAEDLNGSREGYRSTGRSRSARVPAPERDAEPGRIPTRDVSRPRPGDRRKPAASGTRGDPAASGTRGGSAATGTRGTRAGSDRRAATSRKGATGRATATDGRTGGRGAGGARAAERRPRTGPATGVAAPRRRPRPLRLFRPTRRLRMGTAVLLLVFTVLGGRLVLLQLTDGRAYAAAGLKARLTTTVLEAKRGSILDRYGNVLAQSVDARYVFADLTRVKDPAGTAAKLRELLGIPVSTLQAELTPTPGQPPSQFVYLARGLDPSVAEAVTALDLPGIGTAYDQRREVPGHDLAANLIGFTGTDVTGLAGLEEAYNSQLQGVNGSHTYEVGDGNLNTQLPGGYDEQVPAHPGASLELTIDRDLQYEIQQLLYQHMTKAAADFGAAIVIDTHTGEVVAQASYPTYDAASWQQYPVRHQLDAATQITVDPGSVAKLIAIGGALQEGVITPQSTVTIGPTIRKGDVTYHDTHPFPKGTNITIPGILAYSSNVGTITVASRLGADKLYEYQRRFGFGQPTGEGLPGESGGLVQPVSNWSGSSYGSIPIGMGISVTPLQMTAAYAALANNGVWIQPHLVKAIIQPDGTTVPAPAPATHEVVTPQVAAQMRTLFEAVTTAEGATGRAAAVTGYLVAGKTGTGLQVKNGRYEAGAAVSFVGMAPADNPRYVIGVFAHVPKGTGGGICAPTFHDMMTFTLQHFGVPPTGAVAPRFTLVEK